MTSPDPLSVALREKLDAATERPWFDAHGGIWTGDGETLVASGATEADADLIVAAVNALPELLARSDALEVATEALRRAEKATTRGEARNHCREGLAHLSAICNPPDKEH